MGQNTNINLGRKGQFGSVNLDALKGGIKKADVQSAEQIKFFDKFDLDKNGILTQDEIQNLVDSLGSYAQDGKITKRETKKFVKQNGLKGEVHKKEVFELLKNLGVASENIADAAVDDDNISITYKPQTDGSTLTEILNKSDGALNSKTIVKDGKTITQAYDQNGKLTQETTVENGVTTVVKYDENGNVTSTVRKKGSVTEYIEDGKVTKKETNKGSGGVETIEYEYDEEGNVSKTTTTNPDGSQVIKEGETITTINPDGSQVIKEGETTTTINTDGSKIIEDGESITTINADGTKTVRNKETDQVQEFDADGKLIEKEPETYKHNVELGDTWYGIVQAKYGITDHKQTMEIVRQLKQHNNVDPKSANMPKEIELPDTVTLKDGTEVKLSNKDATVDRSHNNLTNLNHEYNIRMREPEQDTLEETEVITGNSLTNENVIYQKDSDGNVVYINKETGEQLSAEDAKAFVQAESTYIADKLYDAAKGIGTKNKQFKEGISNIYSREVLQYVNEQLKAKGYGELKEGNAVSGMPIENLILDEQSRSDALQSFRTLIDNGVLNTNEAARTVKRELEHEVHGGLGITRTAKVDEIMMLVPNSETRVELENQFTQDPKHKGLEPNEGSIVRAYLAADGWKADEVDRFDANWVKNNSYTHEEDQEHRNGVIGRLVFEHGTSNNNENLKAGLGAVDTDSADYTYLSERAAQENKKAGYEKQFTTQDSVQQYIAGKTSNKGQVDVGEVSACNTLMYKGEKPINIQAEEALYEAKNGDFSHVFDSMDPKLYTQINTMVKNGEIPNCKSLQDVYNQVMSKTTDAGEKVRIQANAILSGQVEFSNDEISDFCIQLMHRIDTDRGNGSSSHISAGYTNDADYETVQLKAILQNNPQVLADIKAKVQSGEFKYTTVIDSGEGHVQSFDHDTKADYLQILADTKTVANEAVFLDESGNKITDQNVIKSLQDANMKSLDAMREYVAQLEREYKLGTDAEGDLSKAANALSRYSGLGTDRGDVETRYRDAKVLLDQLEAAAQGKLRDADGNVVSAQDLAQQLIDKENELMQTNNDYKTTIQTGKMAIVMAPVIAATTIATGGLSAAAGAAASAGATTTAAVLGSSWTAATVAGVATGATTYGMNAIEYNTSHTGNTAATRENNLTESLINGGSVFIGAAQMKYISGMLNNANTFVRGGGRLTTVLASDVGVGAAGEYVQTGQVSVNGVAMNAVFSTTGNLIGLKSLAKKAPANVPQVEVVADNVRLSHKGEVNNHRDFIADGEVARNIDQRHLNENQRRMVAQGLEDVPNEADIAAFRKQLGEAPTPQERVLIDAHNSKVAEANAEAHQIGNNLSDESLAQLETFGKEAPTAPAAAVSAEVKALENDIKGLEGNIRRLEQQLKGAKKFGKNTQTLETQLEVMKQRRAAKMAELDALQNPIVKADIPQEAAAMTRENAGTYDINTLKKDLEANGVQYKDVSNYFKNGNKSITFTKDGVEYHMIYDKNGKCLTSLSQGNGTSVVTNFKKGKPVSESIRSYSGKGNVQIELNRTEFNADGSRIVYDFSNNKKVSYDADGKVVSESVLNKPAPEVKHEPTPEEIAMRNAENERLRVEFDEPSTLSNQELLSEVKRLSRKRQYWDKNGVEIETNHTIRKRELKAELEKRGLKVQDGKLVEITKASSSAVRVRPRPELDKYKINSTKKYGSVEESTFALDLANKGYRIGDGTWSSWHTGNPHSAWKMHLYSVNQTDYQMMADVILPYLREHGIEHKCLGFRYPISEQASSIQAGKAFTIYPKSNAEMEQIARDLDYIIKNNNLSTTNTHITGDNNLGNSGRLFYRYEFKSKSQINDILDLSTHEKWQNYSDNYYDANRGEGRYLANDMTPADDPWLNFDPSK